MGGLGLLGLLCLLSERYGCGGILVLVKISCVAHNLEGGRENNVTFTLKMH